MNDTLITVVGNVVATPTIRRTTSGVPVTSFRIASTSRRRDSRTGEWADGDKLFATVNCWRAQAENVVASLSTGDPVVVMGRIYTREYVANEVTRASYEIDAEAVGPDLSRGTSVFTRRRREAFAPVQTDADGTPSDLSAQFGPGSPAEYDSADLEGSVEVAGSRLVGAS